MSAEADARQHYILTADPPTPNGDFHVGHLSGPYLAADVVSRALRLQGHRVAFYSSFDPHQTYVVTTAHGRGEVPREMADHFIARMGATLAGADMAPDFFGGPDAAQQAFVCRFFEALHAAGKLLVRDEEQPYCEGCGHFLFEAYVEGICPHCGEACYGNNCEGCGLPNNPKDLGAPRCRLCGEPAAARRTYRGLFLPLSRYQEALFAHYETRRGIWRQRFFDALLPRLDAPLPDIPLSFVSDYGLPVSIPGFPGQVYNVRLEILPSLLHAFEGWQASQPDGGWHWRQVTDAKVVHFHGFENAFQYCVSFHALLLAAEDLPAAEDLGWGLPYASLTNEFYLLEGQKFSTSRNHAIWGPEILEEVASDALRFYLALTNPEQEGTNLELEVLCTATNQRLIEPWEALRRRLATVLEDAPAQTPPLAAGFRHELETLSAEMQAAYAVETLSLQRATRQLADWLAGLGRRAARLGARPDGVAGYEGELAMLLTGLQALATFATPIMPGFGSQLAQCLRPAGAPAAALPWEAWHQPIPPRDVRWQEAPCLDRLDTVRLTSRFPLATAPTDQQS